MRRVRTKFTQNQKEKILEFAERVGWKLQKRDAELISEFCRAIGVEKRVFKVWLHNNNKMKKFATSDILLECLIQKILCLLSVKEAAKMSILSKAWLHAWSTLSTLKFTFDYHKGNMRMVDDIMERYKDGKIPIEKFELSNSFFDSEVCHLIDKWLDIALQNDVKDLVFGAYSFPLYHMPIFKILAAISLRELVLNECDLMHHVSLSSGVMNCKSLRNLSLNEVNLDENMLQTLLNSCPLMIVTFNFKYCLGLENIELLNLRKIKSVSIRTHRRINQLVKIQAPTLEHLSYTGLSKELEVVECQSLKSLDLSYMTMPDGFLHSLISRFQSLEVLKIRDCKGITKIDTLELS